MALEIWQRLSEATAVSPASTYPVSAHGGRETPFRSNSNNDGVESDVRERERGRCMAAEQQLMCGSCVLAGNTITDKGAGKIAEALRTNTSVTNIDLYGELHLVRQW